MADIKNKNELKRRIELFMDELDYSINEEFCKETMIMMREFIGRASHLLDCTDEKIKKAKRTSRNKTIDEFAERLKERIVGMQMAELQGEDICPCAENGKECPYINQDIGCRYCAREHTIKEVNEIAEQMKGGGKNG